MQQWTHNDNRENGLCLGQKTNYKGCFTSLGLNHKSVE